MTAAGVLRPGTWVLYTRLIKRLLESEQSLYVVLVNFGDETEVGEVAFLLFGFLGQNVTFESVFSFDFS